MSNPKLLMLDEPSMGLAPLVVEQVFHIIEKLKRTGITILLVEQNARMAIKVSDRSYMLNTGKIAGELDASDGASQDALRGGLSGQEREIEGETGIMNLENVKFNTDTKLVLNIGDPMGKTNAPGVQQTVWGAGHERHHASGGSKKRRTAPIHGGM